LQVFHRQKVESGQLISSMFLAFLLARACDTVEWFWQNNRQFAAPTLHQRHSGTRRLRCPATSRSAQLSFFEKMYLLSSTCPVLTFSAALLGQLRFNCPPPHPAYGRLFDQHVAVKSECKSVDGFDAAVKLFFRSHAVATDAPRIHKLMLVCWLIRD